MPATVLHYTRRWLPLSAGFVHAHVVRSAYDGLVVARDPLEHTATFRLPAHRPVRSLAPLLRWVPDGAGRRPTSLALAALAAGRGVGVVHVHLGYGVDDVLGYAGRARIPVVLSLHGEDATAGGPRLAARFREAVDVVARVVVPSAFLAGVAERLGFAGERISIVPSGVDTVTFAPTPLPTGRPEVVFVGRLVEKKGIDVLLDAWAAVVAAVPDARLRIIGAGALQPLVDAAPPGVVHEPPDPARRTEQVRDAIRAATVVVQPSRTGADGDAESLLLVNLEAQASGRPVVSTRHGGIPEFVDDGRTGLLVEEGDAGAVADAVVAVLTDRPLAERLGAAGPAWARQFDVRACTARVDALYDHLVDRRSTK